MGPELGTELVPLPWLGDVVLTSDHYPATGQVSYGFGCLWSGVLVSTGGYWRVLAGDVFGAHVVGRARGPCCEMCSGPMLWDVFGAHVVGCVRGTCCGTCLGPML